MTASEIPTLPTSIQTTEGARPGPTVDGTPVVPGDVLVDECDSQRVVLATGFGQHNSGVRLFDPVAREQVHPQGSWTTLTGEQWSLEFTALGCGTELDSENRTQHLLLAGWDPTTEAYRCLHGVSPLGGTHAPVSTDTVLAQTQAGLREALTPPFGSGSPLASVARSTPGLPEAVRGQVTALAHRRLPSNETTAHPTQERTDIEIPTGTAPPVWSRPEEPSLIPGDRLVVWPTAVEAPSSPVGLDSATVAAGQCVVVLHGDDEDEGTVRWFEFASERVETVPNSTVERRVRLARNQGFVLQLLARDSFVDPIGTPRTYSLHCYRVLGGDGPAYLLAGGRTETTTPRLEHPLTLPMEEFQRREALVSALAAPETLSHPLRTWASATEKVELLCQRASTYVRQAEGRPCLSSQGL